MNFAIFNTIKKKWLLIVVAISFLYLVFPIPSIDKPLSKTINSKEGILLGAKIATDGQWRFSGLDSIPVKMDICIRLFEDEYFYKHPGFNPVSLVRAFKQNIKAGKIVSGGSTISMQLVRIAREGKSRTYIEKFVEIFLATKFELKYSKQEILSKYLDHAPFGGNVVGLKAAAWRYFGRSPFELSWAETACLAVLPNAPSLIYPGRGQELLFEKRNRLLKKLVAKKYLSELDYELAILEPIPERPHKLPRLASHLLDRYGKEQIEKHLNSTLDYQLQIKVREIVERHHSILVHNRIHNAAVLIIDNKTNEVIAYVGNTKSIDDEHASEVDIIKAGRSSGSILKPILFAAMISDGYLLPNMLIPDIPTQLQGFSPKNYSLSYDGAVPAKKALSRSLNIPAIRMLQDYGVDRFLDYLKQLEFSNIQKSADHYGLSLILGGAEVNLWDLVNVYSSMANILSVYNSNSGFYAHDAWLKSTYVNKELENNDKIMLQSEYDLFSASAIHTTFQALLEVNRPDNEIGWQQFSSSRKIAWKTGTSFGFRDAWAVGVTPEYTIGVWVGNADGEGRPTLTGASAAAPILFDVFDYMPSTTWFEYPYNDMQAKAICRESGYLASPICNTVDTVWVSSQSIKSELCKFHKMIHLDSTKTYQVTSDCYPQQFMHHESWFVLPPSWEWYFRKKNPFYRKLPPYDESCLGYGEVQMMEFLYPGKVVNISIPRDNNGKLGEVVFKVVHRESKTKLYWHLDEEYIGTTEYFHEMGIQPEVGSHVITVIDDVGNSISKKFYLAENGRKDY